MNKKFEKNNNKVYGAIIVLIMFIAIGAVKAASMVRNYNIENYYEAPAQEELGMEESFGGSTSGDWNVSGNLAITGNSTFTGTSDFTGTTTDALSKDGYVVSIALPTATTTDNDTTAFVTNTGKRKYCHKELIVIDTAPDDLNIYFRAGTSTPGDMTDRVTSTNSLIARTAIPTTTVRDILDGITEVGSAGVSYSRGFFWEAGDALSVEVSSDELAASSTPISEIVGYAEFYCNAY